MSQGQRLKDYLWKPKSYLPDTMFEHEYDSSFTLNWFVSTVMTALTYLSWVSQAQTNSFHCDMLRLDDVKHGIGDSEA